MTPFRVIVADPAWRFGDRLRMSSVARGADAHYPTMTVPEICALPVCDLAAKNAHLYVWATCSGLDDAIAVDAEH